MRDLDLALTEVVVVLEPELAGQVDGLHRRGVHEVPLLVLRQQASFLLRRAEGVLTRRAQSHAGSASRVDPVAGVVPAQEADAMREGRGVLRERNHVLPELHQTRGSRRRDEIHLHVLQSYEHRLRQRRGLEKARELLVRELPHGIHVVPLSELLDEGSASAALVSHEFLLHRDVTPLAQAAAELRHEQRLPWRGRELVPLRHGDVATRQAAGAGTQQVELDLRRRRKGKVEGGEPPRTRIARGQNHPSQPRVLRANSLQGALPQNHVELRDAQLQSLKRQHDHVLP